MTSAGIQLVAGGVIWTSCRCLAGDAFDLVGIFRLVQIWLQLGDDKGTVLSLLVHVLCTDTVCANMVYPLKLHH